jgi:NADH:ubiquinone reductase (H+-translocating)
MARRILVVGGGYAGVTFANRLARRTRAADAEIVLASARPWFVERVRLHEDVAGPPRRRRALRSMVGSRVGLRIGSVAGVDLEARRATFDDGTSEAFDELVLATGSVAATLDLPGAEHVRDCANEEEALALRGLLEGRGAGTRPVVVIGGGLTGIELATELGERRRDRRVVLLTSGQVGPGLSTGGRAHVRATLQRLGVELREHARVVAVERDGVVLASGDALGSACTIACAGLAPAPLARSIGLAVDDDGRALVDDRLRSRSHAFVRVIGDAARAAPDGRDSPLRMACATALPQGAYAADALAAELRGRDSRPFSFRFVVQCISLGRREGLVQTVDPWDTARPAYLGGRLAVWTKELICRYAGAAPRLERAGLGYPWLGAPRLAAGGDRQLLATRDP